MSLRNIFLLCHKVSPTLNLTLKISAAVDIILLHTFLKNEEMENFIAKLPENSIFYCEM